MSIDTIHERETGRKLFEVSYDPAGEVAAIYADQVGDDEQAARDYAEMLDLWWPIEVRFFDRVLTFAGSRWRGAGDCSPVCVLGNGEYEQELNPADL